MIIKKFLLKNEKISENLPIGLFGNFYIHELTFLLVENNELRKMLDGSSGSLKNSKKKLNKKPRIVQYKGIFLKNGLINSESINAPLFDEQ